MICLTDSSPDTYNTSLPASASCLHICKSKVDLPIPGSPPTNTSEPVTMPPPNTRSSSPIPVKVRTSSLVTISDNFDGSRCSVTVTERPAAVFTTGSSTKESHSLHPGHCPSHFGDSNPHSLQKNVVFCFPFAILNHPCFLHAVSCRRKTYLYYAPLE